MEIETVNSSHSANIYYTRTTKEVKAVRFNLCEIYLDLNVLFYTERCLHFRILSYRSSLLFIPKFSNWLIFL